MECKFFVVDHNGEEWFAYSPTDAPHCSYPSLDMTYSVACMEHGRVEIDDEKETVRHGR